MRMRGKDVVWETMAGIESIPSSWEYDLRVSRILTMANIPHGVFTVLS